MSEIVYDFPSINRILNRRTQTEAAKVEETQPTAPQAPSPWIYGGPVVPPVAPSAMPKTELITSMISIEDGLYTELVNRLNSDDFKAALRKYNCPPLFIADPTHTHGSFWELASRNPLK